MSEWIEFIQLLQSMPQGQDLSPVRFRDMKPMADQVNILQAQIASQQLINHVLFGIVLAAIIVLGALIVIQWFRADRQAKRIKEILATRIQLKDVSGQLIMDVPLELLKNGYKFTVPQAVLNDVMEHAS